MKADIKRILFLSLFLAVLGLVCAGMLAVVNHITEPIIQDNKRKELENIIDKLNLVNPLNILKRGFSLTYKDNKLVKSVKKLKENDLLNLKLTDGVATVEVKEINNEIWRKNGKIRKNCCWIRRQ